MTGQEQILTELKSNWPVILTEDLWTVILSLAYPINIFQVSKDFAFGLFDLDWDVFSAHVDGAVHRVPVIGETGVKSTVCGPGNDLS